MTGASRPSGRPTPWLTLLAIPAALLAIVAIGAVLVWGSIFGNKVNAFVAKKTLDSKVTVQVFNPANKVQSQGYFEALNADVDGYLTNIRIQKLLVANDPSPFNETNLAGVRQECVNAVEQYNAAAASIASEAFRTADLPVDLEPGPCAG